jgi:hypothetical protein
MMKEKDRQKMHATGATSHEKRVLDADCVGDLGDDDLLSDDELSMTSGGNLITNGMAAVGRFTKTPFGEWFVPGVGAAGAAIVTTPIGKKIKEARSGNS